jgi:CBS domain-containing protein
MVTEAVGSAVVLGPDRRPAGIVTDRDLRQRVLAAGRSPEDPVETIMSAPLVTLSPEAFVFEALLEMTRRNLHHLPLVEGSQLVGVVSSHDLLLLQAATPLEISRLIQSAGSLEDLAALMPRLTDVTRQLFDQSASGYEIGRVVAEVNDMVVRRALSFAERDLGDVEAGGFPPAPFAWLALGSEGRREQTIRTDQDNALVWDDPGPADRRRAERYFGALAERAIATLIRLGYPPCPADAMASNPKWRQPLSVWRHYFAEWVRDTTPQHLIDSSVCLDFRPVVGEARLADALREEIRDQVKAWRSFPRHLAKIAVSHAPAVGLLGRFRLQHQGGRRGVNLKLGGMLLLGNALRAYAIDLGLAETNTIERLEAATRVGGCFTIAEADDIREAYETIFRLRLRHQLGQLAAGDPPDNLVDPHALSRTEQARLKEALRAIRRLQGKIEDRYFTQAL